MIGFNASKIMPKTVQPVVSFALKDKSNLLYFILFDIVANQTNIF